MVSQDDLILVINKVYESIGQIYTHLENQIDLIQSVQNRIQALDDSRQRDQSAILNEMRTSREAIQERMKGLESLLNKVLLEEGRHE